MNQAWTESSITNGYAPLRNLLAEGYAHLQGMDPETGNKGRQMYYQTMKALDQSAGDRIPDFLYNWIRPVGLI